MMRVLIVEDEALVAMEIEGMLEIAGHDATGMADDLESAVAAAEADRPDLALVDINLARGCSGLDVAAALKARGVPVMFATGNCASDSGRGLAMGCLHKPITDSTLAAAIAAAAAVLGGGRPQRLPASLHFYD
ncbi:response regulator [Polymorphobacter fuscus]|uniref:Response regulator n=1 Tax=Sandarakinorhabdus fusca TaxID=1439888 RepID=A0A7C9GSS5_9SPHN|nr:response regulator [Polymorphobacter fuscus]KAB7644819.1 response regulator [Polymorphobacter fuscus]MQT18091.1 response regulator [Polymorphobacter fuscus]NJC09409.1 DNA-binding response OmpR family regulator [Polymorphobacter fuscus]